MPFREGKTSRREAIQHFYVGAHNYNDQVYGNYDKDRYDSQGYAALNMVVDVSIVNDIEYCLLNLFRICYHMYRLKEVYAYEYKKLYP